MLSYNVFHVLSLLIASSASYAAPSHHDTPQVDWGPCDQSIVNDTTLSCGFLDVPLDYHDLSVGNARLALVKVNATAERLGTVFFNPGGPGLSGISTLDVALIKDELLSSTGGAYDIVSWDQRGVGNLTVPGEIFCFDSLEEYNAFFNNTIELTGIEQTANFTDPADVNALLVQAPTMQKKYEEVGQKCLNSPSGKYLKYVGTVAAVRDLVSMADVLEGSDTPINYYGISYGTLIGSWFVNMFPERVGRVIFDGITDPVMFETETSSAVVSHQFEDADAVYKGLITGCALAGPSGCPAASQGDGPLDIDAKIQALLKAAHDATVANASAPLSSGHIRMALGGKMTTPVEWDSFMKENYPQAVEIVKGEASGNHSPIRRSEQFVGRDRLSQRTPSNDSPSYIGQAIGCGDSVDPQGVTMAEQFRSSINNTRNVSHMVGSVWPLWLYQCPFWPVRAAERYHGPFNKTLANKILVASTKYDSLTPLANAHAVARQLGESAVLVVQNGFGHATIAEPSKCMNNLFAAYMVNGTIPTNDTLCEVNVDFEVFSGVTTADILAHLPSSDV